MKFNLKIRLKLNLIGLKFNLKKWDTNWWKRYGKSTHEYGEIGEKNLNIKTKI